MHATTCPSPGAPLGQDTVLTLTPPLPSHPPVEEGGGGGPSSLPTRTSGQVWSTDALLLQQDQEEEGWLLWPLLARLLIACFILDSLSISTVVTVFHPSLHFFLYVHHLLLPTCVSYPHSHSVSQTHSHVKCAESLPPSHPSHPFPCSPAPVTPLSLLDH